MIPIGSIILQLPVQIFFYGACTIVVVVCVIWIMSVQDEKCGVLTMILCCRGNMVNLYSSSAVSEVVMKFTIL